MSDLYPPDPDDDPPFVGRGATWLAAGGHPAAGGLADAGDLLGAMHAADELGEPSFVCRRPGGTGSPLAAGIALAGKVPTRKELGAQERALLDVLLEADDLRVDQRDAFSEMRATIDAQFGRYPSLTERQRAWVLSECEERGISLQTPAQRNANVPRGREVAPAWGQGQLPLAPPGRAPPLAPERDPARLAQHEGAATGRYGPDVAAAARVPLVAEPGKPRMWGQYSEQPLERTPDGFVNNCALRAGEDEESCQICRGACPDKGRLLRATVTAGSHPARSRPAILPAAPVVADVTLTAAGATLFLDAGGAGPAKTDAPIAAKELRDSILRSAKATALQARKPVRIVDDAGTELAQIDARGMLHPPAAEPATPPGGGSGARRRRPAASPR